MSKENSVFQSLEIIENRIREKLTVENIADGIYFSKNHYQRRFREIVGDSVMGYVTKRKLTLAGKVLLETNAAIIDIAMEFGYDSREGFTRSFKVYMGVSPTEYRKYGLTAIFQKTLKERKNMTYSKTTNEIIRELNDFIAKAKDTAQTARKCELPWYKEFWCSIANKTDILAENIKQTLTRISDIAEHPDEITNKFSIMNSIDDTAFQMNVMSLHVDVTVARGTPADRLAMLPICEKYHEMMRVYPQKIYKVKQFFNELSTLIFDDMRKIFADKMGDVICKAKKAADKINGYDYIKSEIEYIADKLAEISITEVTAHRLDDDLFKLQILQFSIDTDLLRNGGRDKAMFDGIEPLKQSLRETIDFIQSLPTLEEEEPMVVHIAKVIDDIGYQSNILLFYTRGEAEKLGNFLDDKQKVAIESICERIDHYIHFTKNSADETAFKPIADRICEIKRDMTALADELGEKGGSIKVISDTFGLLSDKVMGCIKIVESN